MNVIRVVHAGSYRATQKGEGKTERGRRKLGKINSFCEVLTKCLCTPMGPCSEMADMN